MGAPCVVHLGVGYGGGKRGFRIACLPPEKSQKKKKVLGGGPAAKRGRVGRCAHPEFVLLQAERVEQRGKLDVKLAR